MTGFGKTFDIYNIISDCHFKKVIVVTQKPEVMEQWVFQCNEQRKFSEWITPFILKSKEEMDSFTKWIKLHPDNPFIIIVSGYLNKKLKKGKWRNKLAEFINNTYFDLQARDEAHFGLWNDKYKKDKLWNIKSRIRIDLTATGFPNHKVDNYDLELKYDPMEIKQFRETLELKIKNGETISEEDRNFFLHYPKVHTYIIPIKEALVSKYIQNSKNKFSSTVYWEEASEDSLISTWASKCNFNEIDAIKYNYQEMSEEDNKSPRLFYHNYVGQHIMIVVDSKKACSRAAKSAEKYFNEIHNDNVKIMEMHSKYSTRVAKKYCQEHPEENVILITITSGTTGVNIPTLSKISFECEPESAIRIFQTIGRLFRNYQDKNGHWKEDVYVFLNSKNIILSGIYNLEYTNDSKYWKSEESKKYFIDMCSVIGLNIFDSNGKLQELNYESVWQSFYEECIRNFNNPEAVINTIKFSPGLIKSISLKRKLLTTKSLNKKKIEVGVYTSNPPLGNPSKDTTEENNKRDTTEENNKRGETEKESVEESIHKDICIRLRNFIKYCVENFNDTTINSIFSRTEEFKSFMEFDYFEEFKEYINKDMINNILKDTSGIDFIYEGKERYISKNISIKMCSLVPLKKWDNINCIGMDGGINTLLTLSKNSNTNLNNKTIYYFYESEAEKLIINSEIKKLNFNFSKIEYISYSTLIKTEKISMQIDLCLLNPPYGKQSMVYIDVLENLIPNGVENAIILCPSTWVTNSKYEKRAENIKPFLQNDIRDIDDNSFKDVQFTNNPRIFYFDKNLPNDFYKSLLILDGIQNRDKLSDIKLCKILKDYCKNYPTIADNLKNLKQRIGTKTYCKNISEELGSYYIGYERASNSNSNMITCLKTNISINKPHKGWEWYKKCTSKEEAEKIDKYIRTPFARFFFKLSHPIQDYDVRKCHLQGVPFGIDPNKMAEDISLSYPEYTKDYILQYIEKEGTTI